MDSGAYCSILFPQSFHVNYRIIARYPMCSIRADPPPRSLSLTIMKHRNSKYSSRASQTLFDDAVPRTRSNTKHIYQCHPSRRIHPLSAPPRASTPHSRYRLRFWTRTASTWSTTITKDRATIRHDPALPKFNWYVARRASRVHIYTTNTPRYIDYDTMKEQC